MTGPKDSPSQLVRADLMIKRLEVKANGKNAAKP